MLPDNDRGRPTANRTASNVISDGDVTSVAPATDDRHCCAALTLDERQTAARFHILCGPGRCARAVLRGERR